MLSHRYQHPSDILLKLLIIDSNFSVSLQQVTSKTGFMPVFDFTRSGRIERPQARHWSERRGELTSTYYFRNTWTEIISNLGVDSGPRNKHVQIEICYNGRMESEKTIRHEHLKGETVSYVINSSFSDEFKNYIETIQEKIKDQFGNVVWNIPKESLHITLMDWLAPFVDYGKHPDELFKEIETEYKTVLREVLADVVLNPLHFETIKVSPTTIFIQANNDSSLNKIRETFLQKINLLPNTKQPPHIAHSSIIRFTQEYELAPIEKCISSLEIHFTETLSEFRLVRETKLPMLEYEVIDVFPILN